MTSSKSFKLKLWERVLWTGVQASVALVSVELIEATFDTTVPAVFVPVIAAGLSWLKGQLARRVGDPSSPATLPAGV